MYCPKCGSLNDDNNHRCVKCGAELPHGAPEPPNPPAGPGAQPPQSESQHSGPPQPPPHPNPGQYPQANYRPGQQPPPPRIENHMAKAILSTLFCCLPLGIASIVYAAQVEGKVRLGDFRGAQETADNANMWANWSIGIGIGIGVIYMLIAFGSALSSM